jgi:hypothetical protein
LQQVFVACKGVLRTLVNAAVENLVDEVVVVTVRLLMGYLTLLRCGGLVYFKVQEL